MFKLIINKADGSLYWLEHFNSLDDTNKWLKEEQTRSYWDKSFTYKIEEIKQKVESPEEIEAKEKLRLRKVRIDELKQKTVFTKQETDEIIKMTLDILA